MPLPSETLQSMRGEANVNAAALDSVAAQLELREAEVETWPNSPSKGFMRDQLRRTRSCYDRAQRCAVVTASMATRVLALLGTEPDPDTDPIPGANTWSTGDW